MKDSERIVRVRFADQRLYAAYERLRAGKFEEKELAKFIERAISDLKQNPLIGIKIPQNLWPKEYIREYSITNLRKYDLPDGWRLIYSVVGNEIEIISVIIEWFDHKNYEKKFKY